MLTASQIKNQIDELLKKLIEFGLSTDQNFPFERHRPAGSVEITFPAAERFSVAMKNISYVEIYRRLAKERAYLVKMIDGAMIQIMYAFSGGRLERHRLAFFPSPDLEEFQNNPDVYLQDEIYADIVAKNIVPFPLRFDFDIRGEIHKDLVHPRSHLTLGQYENCRIPVTAPLIPFHFFEFILRNFYHTAHHTCSDALPRYTDAFDESITYNERRVVHVQTPLADSEAVGASE